MKTQLLEVIKNPNEKFEQGIERILLIDKLTEIARDGFGTAITHEDVENHVLPVDLLYLMENGRGVVGFASYNKFVVKDKKVLYLHGIVIKKAFQGQGLAQEATKEALASDDYDFLASRTQNPVLYASLLHLVRELYPKKEIPEEAKDIAEIVAKDILGMETFDRDTLISRKNYGQCLYDKVPIHSKANEFFDNVLRLNYAIGDCILMLGRLK